MWALVAKIVVAVVGAVVSYVSYKNANKGTKQTPASFDDFDFPQFDEGTPIAHFFGDCWTDDWMVLGVGGFFPWQFDWPVE